MKHIVIFVFMLVHGVLFSQNDGQKNKSAFEKFTQHYNKGDYAAIFASYTNDMQAALPLDKTKEFFLFPPNAGGRYYRFVFYRV